MKNALASAAIITSASQFLCIFCCIVPTATGIVAVLASFGLSGNFMLLGEMSRIFHPWQTHIMATSLSLISLSWAVWFYASKRSSQAVSSESCGCSDKAKKKPIFLMFATGLLLFNIIYTHSFHG